MLPQAIKPSEKHLSGCWESLLQGFFPSRDPSWRTCCLETPRTCCGPNFLMLWSWEQSKMFCTALVLDQCSSTHLSRLLRASLSHGKSDFPLPLDLHLSTREGTQALLSLWPQGGNWGGGVLHHGQGWEVSTRGQGTCRAGQSGGPHPLCTPVLSDPRAPQTPPSARRNDFCSGKRVPDILGAAKLQ